MLKLLLFQRFRWIHNEHMEIARKDYPHLAKLWLSDVYRDEEQLEIDLLIGADYLWHFQTGNILRGGIDEPVAIETELGWVVSGPLKCSQDLVNKQEVLVHLVGAGSVEIERERLDENVRKMWDLETLGITDSEEAYEEFVERIEFNGRRYSVRLPWREGHETLPDNYELSLSRMKSQIRKLRKEPGILEEFDAVIREQLSSGVVEKVIEQEEQGGVHYIPHLAVIRKEATTSKLRVVYDASARENKGGTSLNDCLLKGPSLNPLLFDILLRFRGKRVTLVGDIEKVFLNIELDKADRDSLQFLLVEDPQDPRSKIVPYRFCRVVFGLNASPFLLNATLRYHISKYKIEDPEFGNKMLESFYVDDLVMGEDNTDKAYMLYEKSKKRMARGGFKLRKWLTNDKALRNQIAMKEEGASAETITADAEDDSYAKQSLALACKLNSGDRKVLGISWDCENDNLIFHFGRLVDTARKTPLNETYLGS